MPNQIESAFTTLLPTVNSVPPELVNLASSLVSQSRSKAPLKPDEEIGRTYACCHLACERLKNRLGLEVEKPNPPVPPRIYKKLYAYLDSTLGDAPSTPKANRNKQIHTKDNPQASSVRSAVTPTNALANREPSNSNAAAVPASATRSVKLGRDEASHAEAAVPIYVMPFIRHLCKVFKTLECAPHVFAGVASVIRHLQDQTMDASCGDRATRALKRRRVDHNDTAPLPEHRLPALIIVVYFYTCTRLFGLETSPEDYIQRREKATEAVRSFFENGTKTLSAPPTNDQIKNDVELFMRQAHDGWLDMQWYQNVPQPSDESVDCVDSDVENEEDDALNRLSKTPIRRQEKHGRKEDDGPTAAGLLPGLGTMFQPAVDWLSDARRSSYAVWEQEIRKRIQTIDSN